MTASAWRSLRRRYLRRRCTPKMAYGGIRRSQEGPGFMRRRKFLGSSLASAAALSLPARGSAAAAKILRFVPIADLALVDPVVTTSLRTRCHSYLVFDTLYGLDGNYRAQPQMIEGHRAE